ncbi:Cell division protein FtsL, interacts with FtsB, FtsL and FtsQ [Desulfotomaculum arcticum]|uniref:Cell division protein FtsL n=1 Tax=Desulfotruncus arcticus DSM 17038 TaxID=1121424 RepID=A0A1I2QNB8_9FIRM|nr:cell division protein FtsL [Desulfotruncus arcticus]SFG27717.1 Cell division protein FtsL, interacts with FtsB, FtsL and FtsQ [Desulfotomaculum arcticum] [Desulfotruncus arcticus DSM 17038]
MIVAREKAEYYGLPEQPEKKRRTRMQPRLAIKDRIIYTGLVAIIFCSCAVIASYYAQVVATGYKINAAEKELSLLRTESNGLFADVNEISSLAYVETVAIKKLGMVRPDNDQVVVVQAVNQPGLKGAAPAANKNAAGNKAGTKQSERDENWMIKAFSKMLGRMEQSIQTG